MKELAILVKKYKAACERHHALMSEQRVHRAEDYLHKLTVLAENMMMFGDAGKETLFSIAEGTEYLPAVHAARFLYDFDAKRSVRALKHIGRKAGGFYSYFAKTTVINLTGSIRDKEILMQRCGWVTTPNTKGFLEHLERLGERSRREMMIRIRDGMKEKMIATGKSGDRDCPHQ